jgi:hypothetical protein
VENTAQQRTILKIKKKQESFLVRPELFILVKKLNSILCPSLFKGHRQPLKGVDEEALELVTVIFCYRKLKFIGLKTFIR